MCNNEKEIISNGQYVLLIRKDYKKLHLLSDKTSFIFMGKDKIEPCAMLGEKIGSTFKMIPKVGFNRYFTLELCNKNDSTAIKESFKDFSSGLDNRSICDDGSSQLLTSDSIEELRDRGAAPKAIIEHLIVNSKTFQIKTEYSQEKYIKKKEKKYFEFITVQHPTIRLLADYFYNRDLPKLIGIRVDTLSQLTSTLNFQPDCSYLLVENGFNGIIAATLLNSLSDSGKLIHITPGNQNQKQAVLAMNFSSSHLSRMLTVRLSTITELTDKSSQNNQMSADSGLNGSNLPDFSLFKKKIDGDQSDVAEDLKKSDINMAELRKRKYSNSEAKNSELTLKKPRWAIEADLAMDILSKKVDGLVIACKEFPLNILYKLLVYLLPSRPFVVYSLYQEPLVTLYVQLKQRHDIVYLRLTETWLRSYQILPERSHPAVNMSSSSGYLLSGIKVANKIL